MFILNRLYEALLLFRYNYTYYIKIVLYEPYLNDHIYLMLLLFLLDALAPFKNLYKIKKSEAPYQRLLSERKENNEYVEGKYTLTYIIRSLSFLCALNPN